MDLLPDFQNMPWEINANTLQLSENDHLIDDAKNFADAFKQIKRKFTNVVEKNTPIVFREHILTE